MTSEKKQALSEAIEAANRTHESYGVHVVGMGRYTVSKLWPDDRRKCRSSLVAEVDPDGTTRHASVDF